MVGQYKGPRRYGATQLLANKTLLPLLQASLGRMNLNAAAAVAIKGGGDAGRAAEAVAGAGGDAATENQYLMKMVMRLLVVCSPPIATPEQSQALVRPVIEPVLGELTKVSLSLGEGCEGDT